jgi:hypothetical protein
MPHDVPRNVGQFSTLAGAFKGSHGKTRGEMGPGLADFGITIPDLKRAGTTITPCRSDTRLPHAADIVLSEMA